MTDNVINTEDEVSLDEMLKQQEQPVVEQKIEEEKVVDPERSEILYETKNEHRYDPKAEVKERYVGIPSTTFEKLDKLLDAMNVLTQEKFKDTYSKEEATATGINLQSIGTSIEKNILADNINSKPDVWVNKLNFGDKSLSMGNVAINATGKLTGSAAIAKFASKLGIGEHVMVPLYHSGFWVTIRPPKDSDIINLEIALADSEIMLGRETSTLIYSNYSVIYTRIVVDFIITHIINTSVKVPNDVDLKDLIMIQDLYPLMLGMLSTMYPEGYGIMRNCVNTATLVDEKPVCDYTVQGTVDPMKLLKVNYEAMTHDQRLHMSSKRPDSKTIDEIREYQINIGADLTTKASIKASNGSNIVLHIKSPTLSSYIDNGEEWIDNIIARSQELFTESDSKELKNSKLKDILSAVILGIYNIYISKIEMDDTMVEDRIDVNAVIDMLSGDDKVMTECLTAVRKHINDVAIAIVATANFTCPKCLEREGKDVDQNAGKTGPFKEFIPINTLEHFFDLSALKTSKIRNRDIF